MDEDVLQWVITALKESHNDEKQYHDEVIDSLQKKYKKLQNRMDRMYEDKLDGEISQDEFDHRRERWRTEQSELLQKIEAHQNANDAYLDKGIRTFELAQDIVRLYDRQEMLEKRRILDFVLSNSTWKDASLHPEYRQPFDMLAVTNATYPKKRPPSQRKTTFFKYGAPERIRTPNLLIRSQTRYPISPLGRTQPS